MDLLIFSPVPAKLPVLDLKNAFMAHDFTFKKIKTEKAEIDKELYQEAETIGFLFRNWMTCSPTYSKFRADELNNGISGSGQAKWLAPEVVKNIYQGSLRDDEKEIVEKLQEAFQDGYKIILRCS
jgi:hypothetical protein